jgi:hypothetical protein
VAEVTEVIKLRWFGQATRMPGNGLPRRILEWELEGTRRKGRPIEIWMNEIIHGMNNYGLTEESTGDSGMRKNLDLGEEKPYTADNPWSNERKFILLLLCFFLFLVTGLFSPVFP